jgi:hypothetical protein
LGRALAAADRARVYRRIAAVLAVADGQWVGAVDPGCADVGNHMIDFLRYGDVRKYPNDGVSGGIWQLFTNYDQRISLNEAIVNQGWSSTADRVRAAIHEGWHSYWMSDDEDGAYSFEDGCVDW